MRTSLVFGAFLLLAAPAAGQGEDFDSVEIRTEPVAPGLSVLFGRGGNIAVSTGADGPVLVDDQFAPLAPKILAAVKALQDAPVRFMGAGHPGAQGSTVGEPIQFHARRPGR